MCAVPGATGFRRDEPAPQIHRELPLQKLLPTDFVSSEIPRQSNRQGDDESENQVETEDIAHAPANYKIESGDKAREQNSEDPLGQDSQAHHKCGDREADSMRARI